MDTAWDCIDDCPPSTPKIGVPEFDKENDGIGHPHVLGAQLQEKDKYMLKLKTISAHSVMVGQLFCDCLTKMFGLLDPLSHWSTVGLADPTKLAHERVMGSIPARGRL